MLCLVLMAVELVIVSIRVQSANYTAYKPSTGRPRAAAPGRFAAPTRYPRAGGPRDRARRDPAFHRGRRPTVPRREAQDAGPRRTPPKAPGHSRPARWLRWPPPDSPRTLGTASGRRSSGDLHPQVRAPQAQVTPGSAQPAGFTGATESLRPAFPAAVSRTSHGPPAQVPFPSPPLDRLSVWRAVAARFLGRLGTWRGHAARVLPASARRPRGKRAPARLAASSGSAWRWTCQSGVGAERTRAQTLAPQRALGGGGVRTANRFIA